MSLPSWSTFGVALPIRPLSSPRHSGGLNQDHPSGGGILRVRGWDPPHFDPHLTTASFTQSTLSFVYSILVRHQVDAEIPPGAFIVEPDLAERWEEPNDTTYVFYLRKGVRWHNKPPVSGGELVAEDVKFTYDRFLTEKGNMARSPIGWCANRTWRRSRRVSHLVYRAFLTSNTGAIMMRTARPPFTDVRVRRAISHAIDRQGLIRAVWGRGAPTPAVSRGLGRMVVPHRSARRGGHILSV